MVCDHDNSKSPNGYCVSFCFIGLYCVLLRAAVANQCLHIGNNFRGYDYLVFKHAVAAMHPCIDQGHAPENVITFHKAYLLEFELSVLAVLKVIAPKSRLQALPYWNWFIDVEEDYVQGGDQIQVDINKDTQIHAGVGKQVIDAHSIPKSNDD